jgi:hypothetical protein
MEDLTDAVLDFEAVKIAMTQTKEGHILKLAIHPNDTPDAVMRAPVGSRYQVVMVELSDTNEPVVPKTVSEGARAVRMAALLCRDPNFQDWMKSGGYAMESSETGAVEGLRATLGIESRAMLKIDTDAQMNFARLVNDFEADMRMGGA